jgi:alginate O-acetyltransferase complex protein AlgI
MLFNSLDYALFLPFVALVYFLAPLGLRSLVLLGASSIFYAAWNPRYLPLILGLTVFNHSLARVLGPQNGRRRPSSWLAAGVGVNLLVLGYYKYARFVAQNLIAVGVLGEHPIPALVLPLGISFFVFEFIHYLSDVWSGRPIEPSLLRFSVFATFFPTQIAGPIKRYEQFDPQLDVPSQFDWRRAGVGGGLVVRGLFKKMVLADNLSPLVEMAFDGRLATAASLQPRDAWLAVLAFAMQIYFDFSGYTDIGRGSAQILGFEVPENFRRPYLAGNVSEFWRRWHISLSSWLRDYLYVPLGGNRSRRTGNLLITMLLGGLWHGASWTFVAWGAFHGALLVAYWAARQQGWIGPEQARRLGLPYRLAGWLLTAVLVTLGWVLFRAPSMTAALSLYADLFGFGGPAETLYGRFGRSWIADAAIAFLAVEAIFEMRERVTERLSPLWSERLERFHLELAPFAHAVLLALLIVFHHTGEKRFIYFQF